MTDTQFLTFLVLDGALAGAIYALVALAFVVAYKASRMINFAVGDWVMLASRMVAAGLNGSARTAVVQRLPRREDAPELVQVCRLLIQNFSPPALDDIAFRLDLYDAALVRIGL